MVYQWKQNRFAADAQKVGEELMNLSYRDAASVVRTATNADSELHKCFEWDNSKAGEAHRLEQARLILRMIVTVEDLKVEGGQKTQTYRTFESVRFSDKDGNLDKTMAYIPVKEALSDPELRKQIMLRLDSTIAEAEHTAELYTYLVASFGKVRDKLREARTAISIE